MFINFSDIPGHHNLFLDYIYEFHNVKDFYSTDFRNKDSYADHFRAVTKEQNPLLFKLPELILDQYTSNQPSSKTQKNITLLKEPKTLAVFTGQQLGILGGPLYTIYKTITTIKLAQYLNERFDEFNFVPVFWLEGDDHDFDEVNSITIINEENNLIKLTYEDSLPEGEFRGSVGELTFTSGINTLLDELQKNLRKTEFTDALILELRDIYKEGKTFKESFRQLIFNYFDQYGLILFDPQQNEIKKLLKPIFHEELLNYRLHSEKLILRSAALEETYHAQVKVRPINLFMNYENGRYAIEPVDEHFRLKHKRVKFTQEELLKFISDSPEIFSPNVILRPICQDYLFPTAFYVGGPSEISYFSQVLPLYEDFQIPQPIIYPRSAATLIEKGVQTVFDKYQLTLNDFFLNADKIAEKVISRLSEKDFDTDFAAAQTEIENVIEGLKQNLLSLDKTIYDAADRYKQKIVSTLMELKGKTNEAQKRKYETTLRQTTKTSLAVFPNANLQERELNYFYFANKYGKDFIKLLFEELAINKFEHQVINL
ncbi:MAG: bacillithiol biosynthesis cysteine-adding enzyme BshC [Ignavibacteriaceae bacterium]|jgi:bacillithiol biosynthesis cysteine-adding enzyme BshC|nr:bacillithiol biosynthesis cysteine-adding enzyme BshC [Ignavibacteriaceae bacterium]